MTYLLHGENPTVHKSTGPNVNICFLSPVLAFQRHMLESNELLAIAVKLTIVHYPLNYRPALTLTIRADGNGHDTKSMAL